MVTDERQQDQKLLCEWTSDIAGPTSSPKQVVAFAHLQESDSLIVICANGDIDQILELEGDGEAIVGAASSESKGKSSRSASRETT